MPRTSPVHVRRRAGYSLFEVILVCAVLVILASLAYPSLRGMYPYYKLQGAVDSVRAAWAQARSRAIEEGRPFRFAVENQGRHYRVAPDTPEAWGSGSSDGMVIEQALPPGVTFTLNGEPAAASSLEEPTTQGDKKSNLSPDAYTPAVVFLADGTAREDVRIVFQIKGVRPTALQLRGLTGTSSVQQLSQ
ncbi:MAG: hypothetical protein U0840_18190 [Gemmataceae bacterium]